MTLRYVAASMTGVVFAWAVLTVEPGFAQLRDGGVLPQEESGMVTVVGCLVRGEDVRGGSARRYVLANPRRGPVTNVPEERCTADSAGNALELEDTNNVGINDSLVGRAVEINGRLERETSTDPDNLRELEVRSFRLVPVAPPPPPVAVAPAPAAPPAIVEAPPVARAPEPAPVAPEPAPVGTTGQEDLPRTASPLGAVGLAGLLSLAGAYALRAIRRRRQG